jgi:3-oxoacyl-[acyl-carrier protein] reductase
MDFAIGGKIVFISGSTRGIGWAAAQLFAEHGAHVIIHGCANRQTAQENACQLSKTYGVDSCAVHGDFADPRQIQDIYRQIYQRFHRLDIAINNAGIMEDALLGMISSESASKLFNVNVLGVLHSLQAAARIMMRQNAGTIINVASVMGIEGNAGQVAYSGSKAAVIGFTKAAAKELAPYQIRVNCIAPGVIETDLIKQVPPEKLQDKLSHISLGRMGSPHDAAQALLYLASPLSGYITGQVLRVDGGMTV